MRGIKRATAKLFLGRKLDELVQSSPATDQSADNVPSFALPHRYATQPAAQAIISQLEPDYITRPVTVQGAACKAVESFEALVSVLVPALAHLRRCAAFPGRHVIRQRAWHTAAQMLQATAALRTGSFIERDCQRMTP